jgi:hypothetical protein
MIPEEILNWKGLMIHDNKTYSWVDLTKESISGINRIINLSIDDSLVIEGDVKEQASGYYAMNFEQYLKEDGRESFDNAKEVIGYEKDNYQISDFKLQTLDSINDKVFWTYTFENDEGVEKIGDKVYFSPLIFLALTESPFKKEERRYPISFGFPKQIKNIITIQFSDLYEVAYLPSPVRINLPDNTGSFVYNLNASGNSITLTTSFIVGEGEIPSEKYLEIKEFFKLRVEKEKEKVALIKK